MKVTIQTLALATLSLKPYLDPEEPPFLGFLMMISVYESLKG